MPGSAEAVRPAVVFDLDETLIFSTTIAPAVSCMRIRIGRRQVHIQTRPGLTNALQKLSTQFDIYFFTASDPLYANQIIEAIAPGTPADHRFFRDSCCNTGGYPVKDLRLLNRPLNRTIIIDDIEGSALFQPRNLIRITPWLGNPEDDVLCGEILPLLMDAWDAPDLPAAIHEALKEKPRTALFTSQTQFP
jgi:TFIIF-interacting CTD phosphatase-like protein